MSKIVGRKDPLTTLEDQDTRQRRDALRATKFVLERVAGPELRDFVEKLAAFLRLHHRDGNAEARAEGRTES